MIKFSKLERKENIIDALILFDVVFPHLKEKVESIDSLAEKFCENAEVFLLENAVDTIGFIAFYDNDMDSKIGYVSLIGVLPQYEHQGFGKKLIDFCVDECREKGMTSLKLEVDIDNINAQNFYKHIGFTKTSNKTLDAFYMEKEI